jgi:Transposase DDE domain group 1
VYSCIPAHSLQQQKVKLRADSGFYDKQVVAFCEAQAITFAITADQTAPLRARIEALEENTWQDLEKYGVAQVAELRYQPTRWKQPYRYVAKRELTQNKKGEVYFRYHVLVTNNQADSPTTVLEWHLAHANMENRIKEHKSGFALEKLPTQRFHANWAYLLIGQLAYNLTAWFKRWVLPAKYHSATIKTIRHQLLNLAGKIVRTGRQQFLVLSEQYRYREVWRFAIQKLTTLSAG